MQDNYKLWYREKNMFWTILYTWRLSNKAQDPINEIPQIAQQLTV